MAKPPLTTRFDRRDWPEMEGSFLDTLSAFATDVGLVLKNGVSFENLNALVVTLTLTYPSRWTAPTLLNSWTNYDTATYDAAGYHKDANGRVWLRGVVSAGTYGTSPIFTLPTTYRPAYRQILSAAQSSLFQPAGQVDVLANGNVIATDITSVQSGVSTFLSLDGLSFDASDPSVVAPGAPFPQFVTQGAIRGVVRGVVCLGVVDLTNGAYNAAQTPNVTWLPSQGGVSIVDLPGLLPDRLYRVTLWLQG